MDVKEFIATRDRLGILLGVELEDVQPGYARASMTIQDCHLNGVNVAHGGAIFSLADISFAAASNSHGTVSVAVNVSISFVKAVRLGDTLTAEAREITDPSRLGHYTIDVRDQNDELVCIFQGLVYRKKDRLEDVLPQA